EVLREVRQIIRPGSDNDLVPLGSVPVGHVVQALFDIHDITSGVGMGLPGLRCAHTRTANLLGVPSQGFWILPQWRTPRRSSSELSQRPPRVLLRADRPARIGTTDA